MKTNIYFIAFLDTDMMHSSESYSLAIQLALLTQSVSYHMMITWYQDPVKISRNIPCTQILHILLSSDNLLICPGTLSLCREYNSHAWLFHYKISKWLTGENVIHKSNLWDFTWRYIGMDFPYFFFTPRWYQAWYQPNLHLCHTKELEVT